VARQADLVLIVLDATQGDAELSEIERTIGAGREPLIVWNKIDLLDGSATRTAGTGEVCISALTGEGLDALEQAIISRLRLDLLSDDAPTPISERQHGLVRVPNRQIV